MTRVCRACGVEQSTDDFEPRRATCRGCRRESNRRWYEQNRDAILARQRIRRRPYRPEEHRRQVYDLAPNEYDVLLQQQDGACAACGARSDLVVDHDHDTGVVRGLLCGSCNLAIGLLGDDADRCRAAAAYLRRTSASGE